MRATLQERSDLRNLLLQACLRDIDHAIPSWQQWAARVNLDAIDIGTRTLLPYLHQRVASWRAVSPLLGRLRGVHRHDWVRHQLLMNHVRGTIAALHSAGIDVLVLDGPALGLVAYRHPTDRPASHGGLLVPHAMAHRAADVLARQQWQAVRPGEEWPSPFKASMRFVQPGGIALDLHTHVMDEGLDNDADMDLWQASERLDLGGLQCRTLCHEDHLLYVLTKGFGQDPAVSMWGYVDSVQLIRARGARFRWERLLEQADARHVSCVVAAALEQLDRLCPDLVSGVARRELAAKPRPAVQRLDCWGRSRRGLFSALVLHWCAHQRAKYRDPRWRGILGFPTYLKERLGLPSLRALAAETAVRLYRRARLRVCLPPR